tara:strand:+ start:248 stop:454 length:207 start_codon:yes stop_codon:yes gene_type:complete
MNLKEIMTKEEWDWISRLYINSSYVIGDSRKPKIVKNWAQNYRYSKIIDDEYCEYKKADPRFKQKVKR